MEYTGDDNLDVMRLAENNNCFIFKLLLKALDSKVSSIVDFGAGNGLFSEMLIRAGRQTACVEPADNMQRYFKVPPYRSLDEVPPADFIYSLNVLEHIEDDEAVLREMFARLKPGGGLFLYVPAFPLLYSSMDKKVGHVRRYTRRELISKARAAGFSVRYCRYADFLGFFAALLFRFLPGADGSLNPSAVKVYDKLIIPPSRLLDKLSGGRLIGKNLYLYAEKENSVKRSIFF